MPIKVEIKDLDESWIHPIAELAYKLPNFAKFVSFFGLNFLKNVYIRNVVESPNSFGFVATVNNQFAGFLIVGYPIDNYYGDLMTKRKLKTYGYLIKGLFKNPFKLLELLYIKTFLKAYQDNIESEIVLVAIEPDFLKTTNGNGEKISELLMNKTLAICSEKNIKSIKTETPSANEQAKSFYKKYGFDETGFIHFYKEKRTILSRNINL